MKFSVLLQYVGGSPVEIGASDTLSGALGCVVDEAKRLGADEGGYRFIARSETFNTSRLSFVRGDLHTEPVDAVSITIRKPMPWEQASDSESE
jgi:hypothetical protein